MSEPPPIGTFTDTLDESELKRLIAKLPHGMKHCTILRKECAQGHAWLTATNWVQHECPTCERNKLNAELVRLEWIEKISKDIVKENNKLRGMLRPCIGWLDYAYYNVSSPTADKVKKWLPEARAMLLPEEPHDIEESLDESPSNKVDKMSENLIKVDLTEHELKQLILWHAQNIVDYGKTFHGSLNGDDIERMIELKRIYDYGKKM